MARLNTRAEGVTRTSALHVPREHFSRPDGRPRRKTSLMRRYEAAALKSDGTLSHEQLVAPAIDLFEEATAAFARGTLVATPSGPVAIEDLLPGDIVDTRDGPAQITWIGSTIFYPNTAADVSCLSHLTRVTAEAFGPATPMTDLLIGPGARMVVRREKLRSLLGASAVLAPIQDYTDGDRIFDITPPSPVQMYNFALANHSTVTLSGLEVETYHPGKLADPTLGHNVRALFLSMFPGIEMFEEFGGLIFPRTRREVIDNLTL